MAHRSATDAACHLVLIALRGAAIVSPTAANIVFIARGRWGLMALSGFAISAIWWRNAHAAAHRDQPWAWAAYGLGAAAGTLLGAWIAQWL